jgi:hypothetical protein
VLKIVAIPNEEAPLIDGDLSDPAWVKAQIATVLTTQGGDFGGTHESRVEIRALHDDQFAYFAFTWEDPTRSLKHMPLLKNRDSWQVVATDPANEDIYNEDKFAVLLSPSVFPLIGAAIHLAKVPLPESLAAAVDVVSITPWMALFSMSGYGVLLIKAREAMSIIAISVDRETDRARMKLHTQAVSLSTPVPRVMRQTTQAGLPWARRFIPCVCRAMLPL